MASKVHVPILKPLQDVRDLTTQYDWVNNEADRAELDKMLETIEAEALAAINNYTKEAVIKELEKLLKKQYFAEGYGYDHGQVVDVFDIEDAIKSLKGGIDD